ncbi:MAG: FKBP-type peptidyl-prolyl cis-trans isomerase [Candidatus Nealsonbacteria bacterium]|nr:FKBP-type peptidyl-prolyl cis-trans isomerase [Candidatus Nealsonbacteria bacterium]
MKKIFLIIILIIIGLGIYFVFRNPKTSEEPGSNSNEEPESNSQNHEIQGMKVEILKKGTGEVSKNSDKVTVHYVGTFENGEKFDSSVDRGTPFSFTLGAGQVIEGWDLGVLGMKVGEKRKLTIPYDLAYGESGYGPIPAKATLIFEVELLGINQ